MEPISFASFTLASILASLPANGEPVSQSVINTHISPAIVGQWEIDLDSDVTMTKEAAARQAELNHAQGMITHEPKVTAGTEDGVLTQQEQRVLSIKPTNIEPVQLSADTNQCREIYNFGVDNEMWSVSGKEWTYGRYLVTHRAEGLPIIALKTLYDNNEVDCSGQQIDQTGEAVIAFLNHEGNEMQWCANPDGTECYMNFRRVLP